MRANISTIRAACAHYNYVWPKQLESGIMYFDGARITIEEFNKEARKFKCLNI